MKLIKGAVIIVLGIVMIMSISLGTLAAFTSEDKVENKFTLGNVEININEHGFSNIDNWQGNAVQKEVSVTNKSMAPVLIRVSLMPRWTDENGAAWAGDTGLVTLDISNESYWYYDEDSSYYYYIKTITTDEDTTSLLKKVSSNIQLGGVTEEIKSRYEDKKLIVDVKGEAVIANKEVYKKVWPNLNNIMTTKLDSVCDEYKSF